MSIISCLVRNWKYRLLVLFLFQISSVLIVSLLIRYFGVEILFTSYDPLIHEEQIDSSDIPNEGVEDIVIKDDPLIHDEPIDSSDIPNEEEGVEDIIIEDDPLIHDEPIDDDDFKHVEFSREFAEYLNLNDVLSDGSLDCRPKCVKKDFFTGLFGRKFDDSICKVGKGIKSDKIVPLPSVLAKRMTREIDGQTTICTYPIFTKYIPETDSLLVECPIGSTLKLFTIEDRIGYNYNLGKPGADFFDKYDPVIYCSQEGKCGTTKAGTTDKNIEPRIFTFDEDNNNTTHQMTIELHNEGVLVADCGDGLANFIHSPKFIDEEIQFLEKVVEEKEYQKPPPDIILIVTDTTNRFAFAESLQTTRKLFDEIKDNSGTGVQIFDFMYFNSVEKKTIGNIPPLLSGCPSYNMKTYNAPFPKNHVYTSLMTDLKEHGFYSLKTGKNDFLHLYMPNLKGSVGRNFKHEPHRFGMDLNFGVNPNSVSFTGEKPSITKKKFKYGGDIIEHCFAGVTPLMKYADLIIHSTHRRDIIAPNVPHFSFIHEMENHNGEYRGGQVMDIVLAEFIKELDMSKTILIVAGDHGYWAGSAASNTYFSSTFYNPPFLMMLPEYLLTNEYFSNLKHNEKWIVTFYDIHRTLKELPLLLQQGSSYERFKEQWSPGGVAPGSVNLITGKIDHFRTCKDVNIPSSICFCKSMKTREGSANETLFLKQEFVKYVNNFVPHELCWLIEEWMFEVSEFAISEQESMFKCKFQFVLDGNRFITKEVFTWSVIGDIIGKKDGEVSFTNFFQDLNFRIVSRSTIYGIEKCASSLPLLEGKTHQLCICKQGNDLSPPS